MYCDCGSLSDAQNLFDKMKLKDLNLWVIIMSGYTTCQKKKLCLDTQEWEFAIMLDA